jgi:hypothetical protein
MSINDPIVVEYNPRRRKYILTRGPETFYDDDRRMIEFSTLTLAMEYALARFGVVPPLKGEAHDDNAGPGDGEDQLPLFG